MTAASMADLIVADGVLPSDMEVAGGNEQLRRGLADRSIPVVVADNVAAYAVQNAAEQSPGEEVRFALVMVVLISDGRRAAGPAGTLIWALDPHGKELGNRWFLRQERRWQRFVEEEDEAMWLSSAVLPALQTIAFMHCRNVVVDRGERPSKLARA